MMYSSSPFSLTYPTTTDKSNLAWQNIFFKYVSKLAFYAQSTITVTSGQCQSYDGQRAKTYLESTMFWFTLVCFSIQPMTTALVVVVAQLMKHSRYCEYFTARDINMLCEAVVFPRMQ